MCRYPLRVCPNRLIHGDQVRVGVCEERSTGLNSEEYAPRPKERLDIPPRERRSLDLSCKKSRVALFPPDPAEKGLGGDLHAGCPNRFAGVALADRAIYETACEQTQFMREAPLKVVCSWESTAAK